MFKLKNYQMNENCKLGAHSEKNADGFTWIIFKLHEDTLTNKIIVCRNEEPGVPLNDALKKVDKKKSKKPSKKYKPFEPVDKNIKSLEAGVYCFNSRTFNDMFPNRCNTPSFKLLIEGSNYEYYLEQIKCGKKTNNKSTTTQTKKSQVNSNTPQHSSNNNHSNQQLQLINSPTAMDSFEQEMIKYVTKTRNEWRIEPATIYFNNDYFNRIVNENIEINDNIENYYREEKSNEYSIPIIFKNSFFEYRYFNFKVEGTNLDCYQDSTSLETSDLIKVMITLQYYDTTLNQSIEELRIPVYFENSLLTHEIYFPPDTNIYLLLQLLQKFIKSFNINDYYVYKIINDWEGVYFRDIIPIYKTSTKLKQLIKNNQIYNFKSKDNNALCLVLLPFHFFCFWRPEDKYDETFYFGIYTNLYFKFTPKYYKKRFSKDDLSFEMGNNSIRLSLQNINLQQYNGITELYEIFKNNTPTTTKFYNSLKCSITMTHGFLFKLNFLLYIKPTNIHYIPNDYVDERQFYQMINIKPENTNSLNCLYRIHQKDRETHFDDSVDELCQAVKNLNLNTVGIDIRDVISVTNFNLDEPDFVYAHFDTNFYEYTGLKTSIAELIFKLCKYIFKHFTQNRNIYFQKYGNFSEKGLEYTFLLCDEITFIFGDTKLSIPRDDKYLSAISKKRGNIELNYQSEVNLKKSKLLCILNNQIATTNNSNNNITEEQSNEPLVTVTFTQSQFENLLNLASNNPQQYNNGIQFVSNQVGNSSQFPQNDFTVYNQSVNGITFNGTDNMNNAQISPLQYPQQPLPNSYSQNQQMLGNNYPIVEEYNNQNELSNMNSLDNRFLQQLGMQYLHQLSLQQMTYMNNNEQRLQQQTVTNTNYLNQLNYNNTNIPLQQQLNESQNDRFNTDMEEDCPNSNQNELFTTPFSPFVSLLNPNHCEESDTTDLNKDLLNEELDMFG
ncbi:hypothetical protein ABK040_009918 [Willaertia magna]